MSNAMDKSFDKLRSKFDQFEAPVPEKLWGDVAEGIGASINERSRHRWLFWLLLLFLGVSISLGTAYLTNSGDAGEQVSDLPSVSEEESSSESAMHVKLQNAVEIQKTEEVRPIRPTDDLEEMVKPTLKREALEPEASTDFEVISENEPVRESGSLTEEESMRETVITSEANVSILAEEEDRNKSFFDLSMQAIPNYPWPSFPAYEHEQGDIKTKKSRRWLTRLNFGFQMNYSTINPNPDDDLFLEAESYDFDLNINRLGFNIGYDLWFYMNRRLWLKGQTFSNYRAFNVRFNYEENGDGASREFRDQLNTLSLGMAVGVIYQLNPHEVSKSAVDVLISYEKALVNEFEKTALLSYPTGLWNLNLGYTFSPRTSGVSKWFIRPYAFYGLNRNFGGRAGEVRPYGFGVQFIKHY